jgi:hypothetical protein
LPITGSNIESLVLAALVLLLFGMITMDSVRGRIRRYR